MSGSKFLIALVVSLTLSSCGVVEDQLEAGVDQTTAAPADASATDTVPTSEPASAGYLSDGEGLEAADVRVILESVANAEDPMGQMERLGFVPPIAVPAGAELQGFETKYQDGSARGEVTYATTATYLYSSADVSFEELSAFATEQGQKNGWPPTIFTEFDNIVSRSFELAEPAGEGEITLLATDLDETVTLKVEYQNAGAPELAGLVDPDKFSSWFDGIAPIPSGATFVGGGAGWVRPGNETFEAIAQEGDTLSALFEYPDGDPNELKNEARALGEALDMVATEADDKLILENAEVSVVYDFTLNDELQVVTNFLR